jgi:hypothetical protein
VDRIRELGWQGVVGNTDEMLFRPDSLTEFASQLPQLQSLWAVIEDMAEATREVLGEERLAWLSALPRVQIYGSMALVHTTAIAAPLICCWMTSSRKFDAWSMTWTGNSRLSPVVDSRIPIGWRRFSKAPVPKCHRP